MTEEINSEMTTEDMQKSLLEKDALIQDLQSQFEAVRGKSNELLDEAKKAKTQAREASQAKEQAKIEKAKKDGDFQQLLKSSENERAQLKASLEELTDRISSEKVRSSAMTIASELADGPNAELLSEFISKRIKYVDNDVKVLDEKGNLTVSSLTDLKAEFINSEKYKSLLRGTKSSGGGAPGSTVSGANTGTEIKRSEFDTMRLQDRDSFMSKGGRVSPD